MALAKGQQAPDFELYDADTELVQLSDFEGEHVLLLFFPGAFTSVCTDELNEVNNDLADHLIDGDGIIRYAEVMESAGDMPNFDRIKQIIRDLEA